MVVQAVEEALRIEVTDKATAALIAHDSQAGKHCRPATGGWLCPGVIAASFEAP